MERRPLLVLVGGAPGSGKTTLARRLAGELRLPLLAKDDIKEILYDTLGAPDAARSRELGMAAMMLLYAFAGRLLEAGVGVVVESNFYRGLSEAHLRSLAERARTVEVHCQAARDVLVRRYVERAERGERHPGHHDAAAVPRLLAGLDAGSFEPLDLGVPVLRVDTTAGYRPGFEAIVAWVDLTP
ncbi:MAG: AAA family ATPase [Chloroflexota bacterium]